MSITRFGSSRHDAGCNRRATLLLAALCLGIVALGGCADPDRSTRGEVSGTVLLNGAPVTTGEIQFVPVGPTSGPTSGGPIVDGKYHIGYKLGPGVGEYRVQFQGMRPSDRIVMIRGTEHQELVDVFPSKYGPTSPEKRTIKPGKNELDFDLKSE